MKSEEKVMTLAINLQSHNMTIHSHAVVTKQFVLAKIQRTGRISKESGKY